MARIELREVQHSYLDRPSKPEDYALRPLQHVWEDGGAYALLGPSGCGKTTLLNVISGLLRPSEGRVLFDGTDITDLPTAQRNIAQVFQFPVIYDTMTVAQNLGFPLRNRRVPEAQVRARVAEIAEMLELTPVLDRRARNLSADAKQKISLGRGLVRSDVAAILFDEPLTVIDPALKWQLRRKLKEIHRRYRPTMVYVTHDQNEALTLADQVVVMYEGQVLQLGSPEDLFENPRHTFVGWFIGSPGMNLLPCVAQGEGVAVEGQIIPLAAQQLAALPRHYGDLQLGIRPEYLEVHAAPGPARIAAQVQGIEDLGDFALVDLRLGARQMKAKVAEGEPLPSERAWLAFPPAASKLYADSRLVMSG